MKKISISAILAFSVLLYMFSSCSGCVKKATKSITETGISAIEGVAEAVDENGERLGKITADAAGKIALGVGKSLSQQLDDHAASVFAVTGRTLVQSVDGLTDGVSDELKTHYNIVPHSENLPNGVELDYLAKYKHSPVVDAYFLFEVNGVYNCKFECYDNANKIFLSKEIEIDRTENDGNKYMLVSFAMDEAEMKRFANLKEIKISVSKK